MEAIADLAIYNPDPDYAALAQTAAAQNQAEGTTEVSFCIDEAGATFDIYTSVEYGDTEVDQICRDTVAKWRFRPFTVDGEPEVVCSTITYALKLN